METSVTVERMDKDPDFLPSHEILRENLKKTRKKPARVFSEPNRCGVCGKILSDKASLAHHIQTHSSFSPYQCGQCPYRGKTRKYLSRHESRAHGPPAARVRCGYCGKAFRFRSKMLVHERVHTGEKPNKCDVCGKAFSSTYSLATHKFIHTEEKPFKCSFCEYACRDSSSLRRHEERHMGIKRYKCSFCEKCYDSKWRLCCHTKEIHTAPEDRNHECDRCDSTFRNKWALQRHTALVHDRIKSCTCSVCGKYIPNSYNLSAHMRKHVNVKPFKCSFNGCNASFKDKSGLKKHTMIHYPQKHLICDHCGKGFSRKNRILKHIHKMHDHPNTKSEQCELCGVSFLTKNYLLKHIRTKHVRNRKKFICDLCDFVTHNKPSLVMHIKHGHDHSNKTKCTICGKIYKRNSSLKLHYKSSHNIHFKTKSRTVPEIQIKEEPLDPIPDLEIDLLDIEKEEPFSGFETEYTEDVLKIYKPNSAKDRRLRDLFKKMIHDDDYGLNNANDETTDQLETDPIKDPTKVENQTEDTPQNSLTPLEEIQQDMLPLVDDEQAKPLAHESTEPPGNMIEAEARSEESPKDINVKETQEVDIKESTDHLIEVKEFIDTESRTEDIARNSPMPVDEFLQRVVGVDPKLDDEETFTIDKESDEFLKQRIKEMIMNQRLVDQIRRTDYGRRTLKRFTQEELKKFKTVPRTKVITSQPIVNKVNKERKIKEGKITKKKIKRKKRRSNKHKTESGEKGDGDTKKRDPKLILNSFQCNVCYKLFETKPLLLEHCQSHFELCNEFTLIKCPLCNFVAQKNIKKHFRTVHEEEISISFIKILDREDSDTKSRYYYDTKNEKAKELEIIPSVKILNKKAGMDLDKKNRERNSKTMSTSKLVKKGNEWIVQKTKFDLKGYVLPNTKELDKKDDDYLKKLKKLGNEAKKKGVKMLYPCNMCEKICQNLSALTLHSRKHDPNKKPFAPKIWKHKIKDNTNDSQTVKPNVAIDIKNRTAKPKPIVNKHKCDPKLKEFYENNIRGLNIEFWQFLKIYNKMDREKIENFEDLKNSTEYGIGHVEYLDNNQGNTSNINIDNKTNKINNVAEENINKNNKTPISNKSSSVTSNNSRVANVKNKFTRTIRLSRIEHNRRMQLQKKLRDKIANSSNV